MKTKSFILLAAVLASALCAASCNEVEPSKASFTEGALTVKVIGNTGTKAASGTESETYETQLNSVQIFLFDESGRLYRYASPSGFADGDSQPFLNVNAATYTVVALANAPALGTVTTLSDLESLAAAVGEAVEGGEGADGRQVAVAAVGRQHS